MNCPKCGRYMIVYKVNTPKNGESQYYICKNWTCPGKPVLVEEGV